MRRYLLRIIISLVAFTAGVAAAVAFGGALGLNSVREQRRVVHVSSQPRACASGLRVEAPLPPEPPPPPVAPVVPLAPDSVEETRISVRLPDGTVRVIEVKADGSVGQSKQ